MKPIRFRIRRVRNKFRVEKNAGRGQIVPIASFRVRRDADTLIKELRRQS